jgi:hypothetical protein
MQTMCVLDEAQIIVVIGIRDAVMHFSLDFELQIIKLKRKGAQGGDHGNIASETSKCQSYRQASHFENKPYFVIP